MDTFAPRQEVISAIVAMANGGVIGYKNQLPWYMPDDMNRFMRLTSGKTVIMGRKTYDALGKQPLKNRQNIVLSRKMSPSSGIDIARSVPEAIKMAQHPIFIIGGAEIYSQFIPLVDRIYITAIDADIIGDAFFPDIPTDFKIVDIETHKRNEDNPYDYVFILMDRVI